MVCNVAVIVFTLLEEIDTLPDAEMMPVLFFPVAAAQQGNFFERCDERAACAESVEDLEIGLAFKMADEITKNEAKIEEHKQEDRPSRQHAHQVLRVDR